MINSLILASLVAFVVCAFILWLVSILNAFANNSRSGKATAIILIISVFILVFYCSYYKGGN